ncbi:MAG: iron ABC transporter permease [Clostridiales bacterium]|nr:iron ABC transporter permease [Clostridiales bacterium]
MRLIDRPGRAVLAIGLCLLAAFVLSFAFGRYSVTPVQVARILIGRVVPLRRTWTPEMEAVVLRIRMPRIAMACLVGGCLATAGAAYQGVFQNPMASPDTLGASSGAALGAALAILWGCSAQWIALFAFASGIATVAIVFFIAARAPGPRVTNLILAGIMLGALLSAGISYVKLIADPTNQLPQITYWLMGSLAGVRPGDARALLPMAIGLVPLHLVRWRLNLLTLGDGQAHALGVRVNRLRLLVVACATVVTAASVSVGGVIGWVGLVIPHLCRKLVGCNYLHLLPASALMGATFLLVVDGAARNLLAVEIPIGILTAVVGAPFFLYLLCRRERAL